MTYTTFPEMIWNNLVVRQDIKGRKKYFEQREGEGTAYTSICSESTSQSSLCALCCATETFGISALRPFPELES